MKQIILLLGILLSLVFQSCDSNIDKGRDVYKAYLKSILKDPNSLVIYNESYSVEDDGHTVKFTVDYGAKNSMGGMERKKENFTTIGEEIYLNGKFYNKDDF